MTVRDAAPTRASEAHDPLPRGEARASGDPHARPRRYSHARALRPRRGARRGDDERRDERRRRRAGSLPPCRVARYPSDAFVEELSAFTGSAIQVPGFAATRASTCTRSHLETRARGGYDRVCTERRWKEVCKTSGPSGPDRADQRRALHAKQLRAISPPLRARRRRPLRGRLRPRGRAPRATRKRPEERRSTLRETPRRSSRRARREYPRRRPRLDARRPRGASRRYPASTSGSRVPTPPPR